MNLMLYRTYLSGGTNGELFNGEQHVCSTIELPWRNNARNLSCIPEGRYELVLRFNARFNEHLMLKDVKGRSDVLIHPANNAVRELKGCIAPVTKLNGEGMGSGSKVAFRKLLELVKFAVASTSASTFAKATVDKSLDKTVDEEGVMSLEKQVYLTIINKEEELCM
jgi:hypothetical protein